jgi:hypothetical protein
MPTSVVRNAAAACAIRRARCPLPRAAGQLSSSEAKRSRHWFAENSCPTCHAVHDISSDGYTEPACACYDMDGCSPRGTLFTDARVPLMPVQHCPNCSGAFSSQQKTSDNYTHIAKCLADAPVTESTAPNLLWTLAEHAGMYKAVTNPPSPGPNLLWTLAEHAGMYKAVTNTPKPTSWKRDMRSSIADMDTALTRAAFRRTTRPPTTW